MKNKVRFYIIAAKDENNDVVKDFDMYSFLMSFNDKINNDVDSVRKNIDNRSIRCLPVKRVSQDLKQLVIPIGRMKSEDLYKENSDKKDMTMVDEKLYDMNIIFYSGIHKVAFITLDKNGPSYNAIAKYLSCFSEYSIVIFPVIATVTLEALRHMEKVKGFGLDILLNESLMGIINQEVEEEKRKNLIQKLLPSIAKDKNELNCFKVSLSFDTDSSNRKSCLNLQTVLTILEELDMDQEYIKDFYIRGANGSNKPIEKTSIKKNNHYVEHIFNLNNNERCNSDYIRINGQDAIGAHINDFSEFIENYFE